MRGKCETATQPIPGGGWVTSFEKFVSLLAPGQAIAVGEGYVTNSEAGFFCVCPIHREGEAVFSQQQTCQPDHVGFTRYHSVFLFAQSIISPHAQQSIATQKLLVRGRSINTAARLERWQIIMVESHRSLKVSYLLCRVTPRRHVQWKGRRPSGADPVTAHD